MRRTLVTLALLTVLPVSTHATCVPSGTATSLEEIIARVEAEQLRYLFVGERHGIGPIKRLAVDLVNALVEKEHEVGLYVEGFRTGCPLGESTCWSLARAFNPRAFEALLAESRAPVHAIDPPESDRRAARMAAALAEGSEPIRVVLVGRSHVIHAADPEAEHWVFGGSLRYPEPGDLARLFPREEYVTIGLETTEEELAPYSLRLDGCGVDYVVTTELTGRYWGSAAETAETDEADADADAVP